MNEKVKQCFAPHVLVHSLLGVGVGIVLTVAFPALQQVWLGVLLIAVAVVADAMRKE